MKDNRKSERRQKERRRNYIEPRRFKKRTGINRRIYITNRRTYNNRKF